MMKQHTAEELNALSKEEVVALLMQTERQAALFYDKLAEEQAKKFGRSTERLECLGQESCFNEAEAESNDEETEPELEEVAVIRKKRPRGKRNVIKLMTLG